MKNTHTQNKVIESVVYDKIDPVTSELRSQIDTYARAILSLQEAIHNQDVTYGGSVNIASHLVPLGREIQRVGKAVVKDWEKRQEAEF